MNLLVYKYIDLKSYIFIYPATVFSVLLLSRIILNEELNKNKYVGVTIVIIGIIIFNLWRNVIVIQEEETDLKKDYLEANMNYRIIKSLKVYKNYSY